MKKKNGNAPSAASNSKLKIARLILEGDGKRATHSKNTYWDSFVNLGINIIAHEIEKHYGIEVGYCSMADINDWDMVLVSLTSPLEAYTLVQTFAKYGLTADSVRPMIVIGGAGNLNCKTYLEYGDYFVFGRGENVIVDVVENYLNPSHPLPNSVFKRGESSFDDIYTVAQADHLYPEAIGKARETMLGCPNKCLFCLYTYTRKYVGGGEYRDTGFYKGSDEVLLKDLDVRQGKSLVSSIDGFSERLRMAFAKPVTDKLIRQKLIEASEARMGDNIRMKLYQIMALPTETDEERKQFLKMLKDIDKECKPGRVIIIFVCTPFNADPLTPAQYLPVDVSREWRDELASWASADGYVFRGQALEVYFNPQATPSILTNLKYMIVHRGGTEDAKLVRAIALDPAFKKMRSYAAVKNIMSKYPRADKFVRQDDIGDRGEWGYLVSYHTWERIDEDARRLHKALGLNS